MTETPMISVVKVEQRPRPQQKLEKVTDLNTESAHPEVTLVAIQKKNAGNNHSVRCVICCGEGRRRQRMMLQTFTDSITRTDLDYAKVLAKSSDVGFGKILKKQPTSRQQQ